MADIRVRQPQKKQITIINVEEAQRLRKSARYSRLRAVIPMGLGSGIRKEELVALRWSNVNLDEGYIIISEARVRTMTGKHLKTTPKSDKGFRNIPISNTLCEILKQHKSDKKKKRKLSRATKIMIWSSATVTVNISNIVDSIPFLRVGLIEPM